MATTVLRRWTLLRAGRSAKTLHPRKLHSDIVPHLNTGGVSVRLGAVGRSSTAGFTATVFGCTGFVGRYLVNRLGQIGTRLVVPFRGDDDSTRHLKLMADLGQITPLRFEIFDEKQIAECVRHSDIVFNLITRDYETKNFGFTNVNVEATRNIARISREQGVDKFIQMSCLMANENSPSAFLRTKALGEQAAREEFPGAIVVRSATIYGHEDSFLNQLAWLSQFPMMPVMNQGKTLRRPICITDVATALVNICLDQTSIGTTYELYGEVYTLEEVVDLFCELTRQPLNKAYPPKLIGEWYAKFVDSISPYPKISPDIIKRMYIDEVPSSGVRTLADTGVHKPYIFEYAALDYLRRFRKHEDFHLPGRQHTTTKVQPLDTSE